MAIPAPVILLPTNGTNYSTDVPQQVISGTTDTNTQAIQVNGSSFGVTFTPGQTAWSWTGTLSVGSNILNIIGIETGTLIPSIPTTITVTVVQSENFVTVTPSTGAQIRRYQTSVEMVVAKNPEPQVLGYNFYVSTRSGGINGVYAPINTSLVTNYSFYNIDTKLLNQVVDTAGNLRVTTITEEVNTVFYFSATLDQTRFNALVSAGLIDNVAFSEEVPLFFVASALIYDTVAGQVTESAYSAELQGSPIIITTGIQDLPGRTQNDIILTFSNEQLNANKGTDTKPGTVIRDIMDPVSEEMARVYIIQDFLSRALSVGALQDFDDANGDGISDPVSTSTQKQVLQIALNLNSADAVQAIIDAQFDKLASNVDVTRKGAESAAGYVTFYTENPPIRDMYVYSGGLVANNGDLDAGIASQTYALQTTKVLSYKDKESYYNPQTKRYELSVDVRASLAGSSGNTDSYSITNTQSGVDSDFSVENPNPIAFGVDKETNHSLAGRIQLAMYADTGTEGGYTKTAIAVPGVLNVRIEKAGDPLMLRDYDAANDEHIGGKVDLYIQGMRSKQVSDQIAFDFGSIASQGQQSGALFNVINAVAFQFKTTDSRVTAHTPIFDVTRVHNATRGADYDLSGYQIIGDGDTIDLDEAKPLNQSIGLATTDVIRVDYKFRGSDLFILSYQPVTDIISVVGQISGPLTTDNYQLVKLDDPLMNGNSTIASDGLRIIYANGLPLSGLQTITNEAHILIIDVNESLKYLGVDPNSIIVKNQSLSITYLEGTDYRIVPGTSTVATAIRIIESGAITNGEVVMISYTAIENFTVTYSTNALLDDVQVKADQMKHACADAVAKQAVANAVDFTFTVIPKTSVYNAGMLTAQLQTAVSNYITQQDVGTPLTQSEVIRVLQGVPDVSSIIVPFSRMVKADGSQIVRDDIGKTQWQEFNTGLAKSFITTTSVLTYKTQANGGPSNLFRGVFEDSKGLILVEDPLEVSAGMGRAYIRSDGYLIVSTKDGKLPDDKSYSASYYVYGETGATDINVNSIESLTVGAFLVNFDNPRTQVTVL